MSFMVAVVGILTEDYDLDILWCGELKRGNKVCFRGEDGLRLVGVFDKRIHLCGLRGFPKRTQHCWPVVRGLLDGTNGVGVLGLRLFNTTT